MPQIPPAGMSQVIPYLFSLLQGRAAGHGLAAEGIRLRARADPSDRQRAASRRDALLCRIWQRAGATGFNGFAARCATLFQCQTRGLITSTGPKDSQCFPFPSAYS